MMRIRTLLVPIDFSEASKKAVDYAIILAKKWNSKIVFVHGYRVIFATYDNPTMSATVNPISGTGLSERKLGKEKLMDYLDTFPELDTIDYSDIVGLGPAVDVIGQTAEAENADLIVMGTTGAEGAEEFFIGTNSEKVSRKAPCPLLVIPDDLKSYEIDTVCLALDTDNVENTLTLELLVELLSAFDAQLRIVHIADKDEAAFRKEEILARYKKSLNRVKHSFHVFYDENPEDGIEEFLDKYPIDLMVLLYREHGFFERLFDPGTRRKMVFETKVPLLVLK